MENGIENAVNPFIVTCTPTAQDFSGTMDKTVAEIAEAAGAGMEIVFQISMNDQWLEFKSNYIGHDSSFAYPSFNALFLTDVPLDALIYVHTGTTNNGLQDSYSTIIYPLTRMS